MDATLDRSLVERCSDALDGRRTVRIAAVIRNGDRSIGAALSGEIARRHGERGLRDGAISIDLRGTAGQSFGAWLARGVTLRLRGEANDYVGKGLSGGRIVIRQPERARTKAEDNIIAGNVALYGATSGEAFIGGIAGERFAVRNSGAVAVVEGVGDHGCEYMTGGVVVVLGRTGRNFAAGMSGGVAYVLDGDERFGERCNTSGIDLQELDAADRTKLHRLLEQHAQLTGSAVARRVLKQWRNSASRFVKVMPEEYERALRAEPLELVS